MFQCSQGDNSLNVAPHHATLFRPRGACIMGYVLAMYLKPTLVVFLCEVSYATDGRRHGTASGGHMAGSVQNNCA